MEEKKIRNMEEFAAAAGISRPNRVQVLQTIRTASGRQTRLRIEEALRKYDFRPNIFAMNQNRRMTKNVGILVPYLSDPTFAEIARSIERRCNRGRIPAHPVQLPRRTGPGERGRSTA